MGRLDILEKYNCDFCAHGGMTNVDDFGIFFFPAGLPEE